MRYLLEFLIISLRTLDGIRDSALEYFFRLNGVHIKEESTMNKIKRNLCNEPSPKEVKAKDYMSDDASRPHE